MERLLWGVLGVLPGLFALFLMLVMVPRAIIGMIGCGYRMQVKRQQELQAQHAHCVEIEAQDDGGYHLVPERSAELGVTAGAVTVAPGQAIAPRQQSGIIYVCHVTHSYGIAEATRLLPDGTFLQVITERGGVAYHNTGTWSKQWSAPFWDATLGNEILLRHWADPLEVVLKASTTQITRRETLLPAHAFQPQVN